VPLGSGPATGGGGGPVPGDTQRNNWDDFVVQTTNNDIDLGTGALREGDYSINSAGEVTFSGTCVFGTGCDPGTGLIYIEPPVDLDLSLITDGASSRPIGSVTMVKNDGLGSLLAGTHVTGTLVVAASGKLVVVPEVMGQVGTAYMSATAPWAWTDGDWFLFEGTAPQAVA
jgi:hypothetical protein